MATKKDLRIVIADKGFVYIGIFEECEHKIKLTEVRNIRVWGTTKGLGQLGLEGPQSETILDDCPDMEIPLHSYLGSMLVIKEKWAKLYK